MNRSVARWAATVLLSAVVSGCTSQGDPARNALLDPTDIQLTGQQRSELQTGLEPDAWFIARLTQPRVIVDGQQLDARLQFLKEMQNARPRESKAQFLAKFDTPAERSAIRTDADHRWVMRTLPTPPDAVTTEDRTVPGRGGDIRVRIYRPRELAQAPAPVLVYFHGGGFVFGSVKAVDRIVRLLTIESQTIVVSVDYRLAPEHPFPAAHDDAEDAFLWARDQASTFGGDAARVAVGGDSAGGHLALVTSLRQIEAGRTPPIYQLLYYPAASIKRDTRSYELFAQGYGLDPGFIEAVTEMAFPDPSRHEVTAVEPLNAATFRGMPASIVVTAGFDPLRDHARRLAGRLEQDGVSVVYLNYDSLSHSFLNWSAVLPTAADAARQTAELFGMAIRSRAGVLNASQEGVRASLK